MNRFFTILSILFLGLAVSCVQKPAPDPVDPPAEEEEGGNKQEQEQEEEKPDPKPEKPSYKDVTLHDAFAESFSEKTSSIFECTYKEGLDLRYYPAFPSWNERNTTLMMMRVDPSDPTGLSQAPKIITKEHTFYGSYSIRMRLPNIKAVQPNIGLNAVFTLNELDEVNGYSTIEMMWKMANPNIIYMSSASNTNRSNDTTTDPVSNFKPSGAYYTYGFDWHADKVVWWILVSGEKKTIKEETEIVPCFPSTLQFLLYHSKNNPVEGNSNATQAPNFPYEFEIDAIKYEPYENEIKAWHDEFFTEK